MFDNENKDVTWGEMFQQQERKMFVLTSCAEKITRFL